jgi:hypothetical protein
MAMSARTLAPAAIMSLSELSAQEVLELDARLITVTATRE